MSISVVTTVVCDASGCGRWLDVWTGTVRDARRVRAEARRAGWKRFRSTSGSMLDACPNCTTGQAAWQ